VLSAEPADPVSSVPCTSRLGFPTLPVASGGPYGLDLWSAIERGDVNGDGRLDVVISSNTYMRLLPGTANGTFAAPLDVATGVAGPTPPRLRDMNGDGKLDLVYGNSGTSTVYVRLNNGASGFAAAQTYNSTLASNAAVEVADLNGDGKLDLIALQDQSRAIAVLLATNTGFSPAVTYSVDAGVTSSRFAVGDLSGDGRADIVTVTLAPPAVNVWINNGSGAFGASTGYPSISNGRPIALHDMNADAKLDVVVAGTSGTTPAVGVHLNQGNGTLSTAVISPSGTSSGPRALAFGDVDGDQEIDVIVSALDSFGKDNALLRGDGAGGFGTPQMLASDGAYAQVLGDFDGDGDADMVTGGASGVITYLNTGVAPFFDQRQTMEVGVGLWAIRLVDINADGALDLVGGGVNGPPVISRLATNGGFASTSTNYAVTVSPHRMLRSDLDNDGNLDVIAANTEKVVALMNHGTGTLSPQTTTAMSGTAELFKDGDFNSDGWRDLVVSVSIGASYEIQLCTGNSNGTFNPCNPVWTTTSNVTSLTRGDLDKDGKLDVLAGLVGEVAVLRGNGNGTFTSTIIDYPGHTPGQMLVRDFNADGNPDVLHTDLVPLVALGNGTTSYTPPTVTVPAVGMDAVIADFNGDGAFDVVSLGGRGVQVTLGNGDGTFQTPAVYEASRYARTVSVTDVNGDGRLDIVVDDGVLASILLGRCLP
jgi:hypothetical protein